MYDIARIYSANVSEVIHVRNVSEIKRGIIKGNKTNKRISISAKRHSQGGHTFYPDAIVLDMTNFNKVISFNKHKKTITVQSGITWEEIQNYINPYDLAIKVQQSSNIFSIGGSLSVNAHGRDPNYSTIIETVISFRIMLANGNTIDASRETNTELFSSAIGGFGLIGVILDVTLSLTDNVMYERKSIEIATSKYFEYFRNNILNNKDIGLHYAWPSIATDDIFSTILVTSYYKKNTDDEKLKVLTTEEYIPISTFFFSLSRNWDWGKDLRWHLQKSFIANTHETALVSRNNAMRPNIRFTEYKSPSDTDILQEYFIPTERIANYLNDVKTIIKKHNINLLSCTIRYVHKNTDALLSYAKNDAFAVVLYINQKLSGVEKMKSKQWTRELVDTTLNYGGTYYLPYQLYPSKKQLLKSYENFYAFIKIKNKYDPNNRFMNMFYKHYFR